MYHTSAQIAAMADAHFLIEKAVENKSTVSRIRRLTDNDSVAELARMLGGAKITDTVMESAREMKHLPWRKKHYHKYYVEGVEVIIGGGICMMENT